MPYCTIADVKEYLSIKTANDDALLQSLIDKAEDFINCYTGRCFEDPGTTTRFFAWSQYDRDSRYLMFDGDAVEVSAVRVNGSVVDPSNYADLPRNKKPLWGLEFRKCCFAAFGGWNCDDIEVDGKWCYSLVAPQKVKFACLRLASFYYRQKDAQVFDTIAEPVAGVITIPAGLPADVRIILNELKRDGVS